jgi:hypothetical protein
LCACYCRSLRRARGATRALLKSRNSVESIDVSWSRVISVLILSQLHPHLTRHLVLQGNRPSVGRFERRRMHDRSVQSTRLHEIVSKAVHDKLLNAKHCTADLSQRHPHSPHLSDRHMPTRMAHPFYAGGKPPARHSVESQGALTRDYFPPITIFPCAIYATSHQ